MGAVCAQDFPTGSPSPIPVCLSADAESSSPVVMGGAEHPPVSESCWLKLSL